MKKYRRVEINAYRRRVTIVSGEWPRESFDMPPVDTTDEVSLNDSDVCEPVEPDSSEGQLILVEAVRSLEQRLSPEARALICAGQNSVVQNGPNRNRFYLKLQSLYQFVTPRILNFFRKKDHAVKQSVEH